MVHFSNTPLIPTRQENLHIIVKYIHGEQVRYQLVPQLNKEIILS